MERISIEESNVAKNAKERKIADLDSQTEGLCKTIGEVKRIVNEQLLKDSGLTLQEQYDLWRKVELLALEGEKDLTLDELTVLFKANSWELNENGKYVLASSWCSNLRQKFIESNSGMDYNGKPYGIEFNNNGDIEDAEKFKSYYGKRRKLRKQWEESQCEGEKPNDEEIVIDRKTFDNEDFVITDPCYLDDNFDTSSSHSTLYGDWSCTTFRMPDKSPIGEFCADGGEVCVSPVKTKEQREYIDKMAHHTRTIIEKFTGTVVFIHKTVWFASKGKWTSDKSLYLSGSGYCGKEKFKFITAQTGL